MNNELERVLKQAVATYLRHCCGIYLGRLRKATKNSEWLFSSPRYHDADVRQKCDIVNHDISNVQHQQLWMIQNMIGRTVNSVSVGVISGTSN